MRSIIPHFKKLIRTPYNVFSLNAKKRSSAYTNSWQFKETKKKKKKKKKNLLVQSVIEGFSQQGFGRKRV